MARSLGRSLHGAQDMQTENLMKMSCTQTFRDVTKTWLFRDIIEMMMREMEMTVTPKTEVSLIDSLIGWMSEVEVRSNSLTEVILGAGSEENLPEGGIGKAMISLCLLQGAPLFIKSVML
jgi:hypothetical protein